MEDVRNHPGDFSIAINLFPGEKETLLTALEERRERIAYRNAKDFLNGILHRKLIPVYMKLWKVDPEKPTGALTEQELLRLAGLLTNMEVQVAGTKGWKEAQVTAGGVFLDEVDSKTMGSKRMPGLYLVGELLNVDGPCGGYNLQWAWTSGYLAGSNAGA